MLRWCGVLCRGWPLRRCRALLRRRLPRRDGMRYGCNVRGRGMLLNLRPWRALRSWTGLGPGDRGDSMSRRRSMLLNLRSWRALRSRTGFLPGDCWCGMSRGRSVLFNLGFRSRLLCGPRTRLRAAWCGGLLLGHWLGDSHVGRMASVRFCERGFVSLSLSGVLSLGRGWARVLLFYRHLLRRGCRVLNSARAAVV